MPDNKNDEKKTDSSKKNIPIKPKREEIFSTASREVRLTKNDPLKDDNPESKENTESTKDLQNIINYLDKVKSNDDAKPKVPDPNQISFFEQKDQKVIIADGEKKTAVFKKPEVKVTSKDIDDIGDTQAATRAIDRSAPEKKNIDNSLNGVDSDANVFDDSFLRENVKDDREGLPVMSVSVGKFSNIVKREYDNYVAYDSEGAHAKKSASYDEVDQKTPPSRKKSGFSIKRLIASLISALNTRRDNRSKHMDTRQYENEYSDTQDASLIRSRLHRASTLLYSCTFILVLLTIGGLIFYTIKSINPTLFGPTQGGGPFAYCVINLVLVMFTVIAGRLSIISGIRGIMTGGNRNTAAAVAALAVSLQAFTSFFNAQSFYEEKSRFFTPMLMLIMLYMTLSSLNANERTKANFRYLNSSAEKYVLRNYKDKHTKSLIFGSAASPKNNIVYQRPVHGFKSFFDLSCEGYSGMTLMNRSYIIIVFIGLIVGIINSVQNGFWSFFTAFASVCCCWVPINAILGSEFATSKYAKMALNTKGMITGYAAGRRYRSSCGVIMSDRALYPKGAAKLVSLKKLNTEGVDDALMAAYVTAKAANSPIQDVFTNIFPDGTYLNKCDNVIYEDEKGLIGWVNGERIFVGNAELLRSHGIDTPSRDFEERYSTDGNSIAYIATQNKLCVILIIKYRADVKVARALKGLEEVGSTLIVRTNNESITPEKIADDFCLYNRSVRVLPSGLGNIFKELSDEVIDDVRPYALTTGGFISMAYCYIFSKKLTSIVRTITLLQVISAILCLIGVSVMLITGSMSVSPLRLIIYTLIWTGISVALSATAKRK